jgi:hypothetical protein
MAAARSPARRGYRTAMSGVPAAARREPPPRCHPACRPGR